MMHGMPSPRAAGLALVAALAAGCRTVGPPPSGASASDGSLRTAPLPGPALSDARQRRWADNTLATLSLRERVGQMVMVWTLGDYTNTRDPSYAQLIRWIEADGVGGVAMSLGTPIEVAAKLNDLQSRARVPLIVGADLEPGLGRLEGGLFSHYLLEAGSATVLPPAMAIAATGRDEDAHDAGRIIALEGRAAGIHINFAPVVDVNNNPANPIINTRSYGEDPELVSRLSAANIRGMQSNGMLATAKHFPGHGDTGTDSHIDLPVITVDKARADRMELPPYRSAIDAGVSAIMTAHIAFPALTGDSLPATLNPRILTGLLRDELKFQGIVFTDAMDMGAIVKNYVYTRAYVMSLKAGHAVL